MLRTFRTVVLTLLIWVCCGPRGPTTTASR